MIFHISRLITRALLSFIPTFDRGTEGKLIESLPVSAFHPFLVNRRSSGQSRETNAIVYWMEMQEETT